MEKISNEFNTTCEMFLDLIYSFTNDSDISYYKKLLKRLIITDKNKMIEQFIIHCYKYKDEIGNKNINFFFDNSFESRFENDSLLELLKAKHKLMRFDEDQINLIFEYLILLNSFCTEYLKLKFK